MEAARKEPVKVTRNGGERYSERDVSYEALINKPDMQLTVLQDTVQSRDRKAIIDVGMANVLEYGKQGINGMPSVTVTDLGREVHVSRKSLQHGLDRRVDTLSPIVQNVGKMLS